MAARSDDELCYVVTRTFDAPRAIVYRAWTDPKQMAQWFGPRAFTCRCEGEARPGGAYRLTMIGEDRVDYPIKGVWREVVEPERLVFTMDLSEHPEEWHDIIDPKRDKSKGRPKYETVTTVTFAENAGKTTLTLRVKFDSKELRDRFVNMGMRVGWEESFDKLDDLGVADRMMIATRVFDASRELVWQAWTDPKHIARWWGPRGFTNTIERMDLRPGGHWTFVMHGPDGKNYENEHVYAVVDEPNRIVMDHVTPPRFRMTATFGDAGPGKTRVTMRGVFESREVRDRVVREVKADRGLVENLEKLGEHLAATSAATEARV
jgi:uncharacterized protein YndB with AHSA1/START domain